MISEAMEFLKSAPKVKFNESIDVAINLGIDPSKSDQNMRGATLLPAGSGKPCKVAVFVEGDQASAAKEAGAGLKEFKLNSTDDLSSHTIDSTFSVDTFEKGQKVDVTGVTIGKGFSGAQKRHHFRSQRATHGVSVSHNSLGSTGHCQDPGRVFPGKKMSGQLGSKRRTTQNLEVVRIDSKRNLILIKGAIPGSKGSDIEIKPAIKVKVGK